MDSVTAEPGAAFDFVIRQARRPGDEASVDVAIADGRFAAVRNRLEDRGSAEIDAAGRLLLSPLSTATSISTPF